MKKGLFLSIVFVSAALLTSCATNTPAPVPGSSPASTLPTQSALSSEMKDLSAEIQTAGGLAALGIHESRSLELALNMAKKNGRIELARTLNTRVEALAKAFSEESGIPYDSLLLSGFNHSVKIIKQQIVGSVAQALRYEMSGETFTAYALMGLDPKVIADQLAKETDLYTKLQPTQAFKTLEQEIKTYETFKTAQEKMPN